MNDNKDGCDENKNGNIIEIVEIENVNITESEKIENNDKKDEKKTKSKKNLKKFFSKFVKSNIYKSLVYLTSGTAIGQIISIIALLIISRLYSPEIFGEQNVIISVGAIIMTFSCLGLTSAIVANANPENSRNVCRLAALVQFIIIVILLIIFIALSPFVKIINTTNNYYISLLILVFYIVNVNISNILFSYNIKNNQYKIQFVNKLITSISFAAIGITWGLLRPSLYGLFAAQIISVLLGNIFLLFKGNPFWGEKRRKKYMAILKDNKEFPLYQMPANAINKISDEIPNQTISNAFGNEALGYYSMAMQAIRYPLQIIATPISFTLFKTVTDHKSENKDFSKIIQKAYYFLLCFSIIPFIAILYFGEPIFSFILGNEWGIAGQIASILSLYFVFYTIINCFSYGIVSVGKHKTNFILSIVKIVLILSSIITGALVFNNLTKLLILFQTTSILYILLELSLFFYYSKVNMKKIIIITLLYILAAICLIGFKFLFF